VIRIVLAVLAGTLAYRLVLVLALRVGLPGTDLQGVTALTLVVAVAARRWATPMVGRAVRATTLSPIFHLPRAHKEAA
jgi:putative ABC transport system permease protein